MLMSFERGLLYLVIGLVSVYMLASLLVPAPILIEVADALVIPISFAAAGVYFREVWVTKNLNFTGTDGVMIGICGAWLVTGLDRTIRLWARLHDATVLDEPLLGLFLFMQVFFAALHVRITSGRTRTMDDNSGTHIVAISLILGAVLATCVIVIEFVL